MNNDIWAGSAFGNKSMDQSMNPTLTYGNGNCTPDTEKCMDKMCKVCATKP